VRSLVPILLLLAAPAQAAEPCGGLTVARGAVTVGQPLPVSASLNADALSCLTAIGRDLSSRPALRTVTVAVRLPDAERLDGHGLEVAQAYADALAAAGVPRSRLSEVAPAAPAGQAGVVQIAFTEKQSSLAIALAESVGGAVLAGPSQSTLQALKGGDMLPAETVVQTKNAGRVTLGLADGSRLRLAERSTLILGGMHLNEELRRVVDLRLEEGRIEAHVSPGGPGSSFTVQTRSGVAGVRGTQFRVVAKGDDTRVETLTGLVALTSPNGTSVDIPAGMRASIGADGVPSGLSPLLPEPELVAPLEGPWTLADGLKWKRVRGANLYLVDLARDAEFTLELVTMQALRSQAKLPDTLGDGKWFWRVTAQDQGGNDGLPSRIYAFVLGGEAK